MGFNSGLEKRKSNASIEAHEKSIPSKISIRSEKSKEETTAPKRPKSSSGSENTRLKKKIRVRSKTAEGIEVNDKTKTQGNKTDPIKIPIKKPSEKAEKGKSETNVRKKVLDFEDESQKSIKAEEKSLLNGSVASKTDTESQSFGEVQKRISDTSTENSLGKAAKTKVEFLHKKPSEIPKLKNFLKATAGSPTKINMTQSKLPVKKTAAKDTESLSILTLPNDSKTSDTTSISTLKSKSDKTSQKSNKGKKEVKIDDKIKETMNEEFSSLVPLYETELKNITDIWVNTIYCSLTMRTNLVKLLFQAFPHINRSQFQTEDEKLLKCIAQAKKYTQSESENLITFIRSLIANIEKTKEQYSYVLGNKEVAELYNHDWRRLTRKIAELGEEVKLIQIEAPELQKKKDALEYSHREKIKYMEANLAVKEEEIQKLANQLNILKQKESTYKGNVLLKVQDYKEIKADVMSLRSTEKEFEELKAKFMYQNEMYEKKIKDLEFLLEEKKKVLEKEKEVKQQLQHFWEQFQAKKKKVAETIGKDQLDFVLGKQSIRKNKRQEQLWMAAVKLVLRGFLIQMNKLERDRNKMLMELQSNDSKNFNNLAATIIRKDHFIKSIKHQMIDFQKACNFSKVSADSSCFEN